MSFFPIKPNQNYIIVRVPVPTILSGEKEKVSTGGIILSKDFEVTTTESERISRVLSFYSGLMKSPMDGQIKNIDFRVPKVVQVVADSNNEYNTGDYLVLSAWQNSQAATIDEKQEYLYLPIEKKFVIGTLENTPDGETIFQIYKDNEIEDSKENIAIRTEENKKVLEQLEELKKQQLEETKAKAEAFKVKSQFAK